MKKSLLFLVLAFVAIASHSQNCFETFIESEDGVFREAGNVVETDDHGFIISCRARYIHLNDMLVSITAEGEIANRLVFQIDGKNLKYCGLFKNLANAGEYTAIAVLTSGNSSTSYVQNELAFLRFDSNLNILSQKICQIGEEYVNMATNSWKDLPRFVMNTDGTFLMAAHCLKDNEYCYLFAKITSEGDIVSMTENTSLNERSYFLIDLFAKGNGNYGMISWANQDNGGNFYYTVDSSFNCVRIARLTGSAVRIVQNDPLQQFPDTTFSYFGERGSGVLYDDTTFLITSEGRYLRHLGGSSGYAHFIAKVNDSVDVVDSRTWECVNTYQPNRLVASEKALSITDEAIYHCGFNGHFGYGQIYNASVSATIITISKFDKDMNLIWRRHYGVNDNSYEINVIQATEDGGCILTGVSASKPNYSYYISYVLKLDADGYDSVDETETIAKPYLCYPNPAGDNLYIDLSPDVSCQSVEIYDMDGRLVETFPETSYQTTIDISGLNAGMYIMKIRMADGREFSEKIVKE